MPLFIFFQFEFSCVLYCVMCILVIDLFDLVMVTLWSPLKDAGPSILQFYYCQRSLSLGTF